MLLLAAALLASPSRAERVCDGWHAELVAVEGTVEMQTTAGWQPLESGATVCMGDSLRVKGYSRAAIRLPDKTVLRLDEHTSLTFSQPQDDTGSWLDVIKGVIHVISRDPRALRFNTPYANAGLEGTEFVIEVAEGETDVTVLEGEVLLSNSQGSIGVPSGQRGTARRAQAPRSEPIPDATEAIRWTPYYVPILGNRLPGAEQTPTGSEAQSAAFYTLRAARRLSVGDVAEAREDLERARAIDPEYADAFALESMIALGEADVERAAELAARATAAAPTRPAGWLARSYVEEANYELLDARASAEHAVDLAPEHAFGWARVAEMRLATGDQAGARQAAERGLALDRSLGHAEAVLGFAELAGGSSAEAEAHFREAARLDSAAPLPRLGLGLVLVRQGELEAGREQMEIAVILDPTDALSRSYMAKIYDVERRRTLSASQLQLAKELGSRDPTAWYYDALRKQSENRPVEAFHDLQAAIDLNDQLGVYRSRLVVDEDLAARSAGIGRLHRALGFEQLALLEGWRSVTEDPADYSGHRLLADVYSYLPRHEIARVNELFQSQLLQPLNLTPVRPQLAEANLFVLDTLGPSALAFTEFRPPIRENGLSYQISGTGAGNGTKGADVAIAGLHDRVSYSVGRFDFETDGFRPNNDFDQRVTNALVQFRPAPETSIFTELRSTEIEKGDLELLFDPESFDEEQRVFENVDSVRIGSRHRLSERQVLLGALIHEKVSGTLDLQADRSAAIEREGYSVDVRHFLRLDRWQLTGGLALSEQTETATTVFGGQGGGAGTLERDLEQFGAYVYGNVPIGERLTATVGVSIDHVAGQLVDRTKLNPKLGLVWQVSPDTAVRLAAFRTLQGPFVSRDNIRPTLEQTHVAGFNQQFFGLEGEEAWRYGAAVDHRFSPRLYGGIEASRRTLSSPGLIVLDPDTTRLEYFGTEEALRRAYLYWTPSETISAGASYQYEQFDYDVVLSAGAKKVSTHRLPFEVHYFHPSGFTAGITTTFVDQSGDFSAVASGPGVETEHGEDSFWVADLSLGYRLPSRRGQISLNVYNAFDEEFRFQDTDPENPRILPERMVLMRFTLSY
ncbi:MAG TPA: TonB-dependent receptor [Gammaproteobacteria bacterium]